MSLENLLSETFGVGTWSINFIYHRYTNRHNWSFLWRLSNGKNYQVNMNDRFAYMNESTFNRIGDRYPYTGVDCNSMIFKSVEKVNGNEYPIQLFGWREKDRNKKYQDQIKIHTRLIIIVYEWSNINRSFKLIK